MPDFPFSGWNRGDVILGLPLLIIGLGIGALRARSHNRRADPKETILADRLRDRYMLSGTAVLRLRLHVRRAETVANAPHRLDNAVADVVELAPQSTDVHIDSSCPAKVVVAPNPIQYVFAPEHAPGLEANSLSSSYSL